MIVSILRLIIFLSGVIAVFLGAFCFSVDPVDDPLMGIMDVRSGDFSLEKSLEDISKHEGVHIVMEISAKPVRVTLKAGKRRIREIVDEIATQTGTKKEETKGIVVLRPVTYPATSASEENYRKGMEQLADFLEEVPPRKKQSIAAEEWLNYMTLSKKEQERVRAAVLQNQTDDSSWNSYMNTRRAAVGFIFDPYIQIEETKTTPSKRLFIRSRHVLPRYARLKPGDTPDAFRPGFQEKEK